MGNWVKSTQGDLESQCPSPLVRHLRQPIEQTHGETACGVTPNG
jgi:hypothetical protein